MDEMKEIAVREALFSHLDALVMGSADQTLNWDQTASFKFQGETFPIRQTRGGGINKPSGLEGALSITTTFTPFGKDSPYDDIEGDDGYPRYKYQGTDPNLYTNRSLRVCMEHRLPLVYFIGVLPATYKPVYPIYVIADNPNRLEVTLGFSRSEIGVDTSQFSPLEKRYSLVETRRRLHQPIFRERVLHAYSSSCSICSIKHRELLDAAHIISDSHQNGEPIVPNGISLCKIHHAAFDRNFIGIRPDYRVVVNANLLNETDGPMLRHGIQEMHGTTIHLPRSSKLKPGKERLDIRFHEFLNAS
jgi:putative restriction endonuclease